MLYTNRRGAAAVLALIFVAVFGLLSVALHTMTMAAISTAANDKAAAAAQGAAESGFEFTSFLLSRPVNKFASTSVPDTDDEITAIKTSLLTTYGIKCSFDGAVLRIPDEATGTITLFPLRPSEKGNFFATVVADAVTPHKLNVTVTGSNDNTVNKIARTISASCVPVDTLSAIISPLDFGVASKGPISSPKNGVKVKVEDTGATDIHGATMMSTSTLKPSISVTKGDVIGTVWVTDNINQAEGFDSGMVKVLPKVPVVFDDYVALAEKCYNDSMTCERFANWDTYKSNRSKKIIVYIEGPSEITMGEATFENSLVFGPNVKKITIDGKKQNPTIIIGYHPGFKYALLAPAAHITYKGNTETVIEGYVVADKFDGNSTSAAKVTITEGGLVTLNVLAGACDVGQVKFDITLPEKKERPNFDTKLTSRRYVMNYSGYQEH